MSFIKFVDQDSQPYSMVNRCSDCCYIMNDRVDISDIDVGSRIRVGDSDIASVLYIGEVSFFSA